MFNIVLCPVAALSRYLNSNSGPCDFPLFTCVGVPITRNTVSIHAIIRPIRFDHNCAAAAIKQQPQHHRHVFPTI